VEPPVEPKPMTVSEAVSDYVVDQRVGEAVDALINHPGRIDAAVDAMQAAFDAAFPVEVLVTAKPEPVQPAVEPSRRTSHSTPEQTRSWGQKRVAEMSDDLQLEIAGHYDNMDISTQAICGEYHINQATLMALVRELGITPRSLREGFTHGLRQGGRLSGYFSLVDGKRIWMTGRKPTAAQRSYEKGLRDAQRALPSPPAKPAPKVQEPREPMPTLHTEYTDDPLWIVHIEAQVEIRAERIEDVIVQARIKYPHARIRGINLG
jgi:hypothetical protein